MPLYITLSRYRTGVAASRTDDAAHGNRWRHLQNRSQSGQYRCFYQSLKLHYKNTLY